MCIKYNQIKNGNKNQSQKVNWLMHNLVQVIISADDSHLVPEYRCCCTSSRWRRILIFATACSDSHTIFMNFQIYRYFQLHRVQSQFQAALIQIVGPKSQIGQREYLAGHRSFASLQLESMNFLGLVGRRGTIFVLKSLIWLHLCYKSRNSYLACHNQSWQILPQKEDNVTTCRHQAPSRAHRSEVELFSYIASRPCTVSPGIHKFNVFFLSESYYLLYDPKIILYFRIFSASAPELKNQRT